MESKPVAKASAPAKCILFGEHAAVYGEPGIAAPLSTCRARALAHSFESGFMRMKSDLGESEGEVREYKEFGKYLAEKWEECYKQGDFSEIFRHAKKCPERVWLSILSFYFDVPENFSAQFTVKSNIPLASGLGSSAAVSASVAKCFAKLLGSERKEKIFEASLLCEKMFHGTPSGIDSAIACYENTTFFVKNRGFEFISPKPLDLFLIYTNKPKSTTGELVQRVRNLEEGYRNPVVKEIGRIVRKSKTALERGDIDTILENARKNQELLSKLGVSSEEIDSITGKINEKNGIAAKLTGAGGGGFVLGFYSEEREKDFEEILRENGYEKIYQPDIFLRERVYWKEKIA